MLKATKHIHHIEVTSLQKAILISIPLNILFFLNSLTSEAILTDIWTIENIATKI